MTDYQYTDLSNPQDACAALAGAERIGVDTEFMREKTYHSQLCLLQFSVDEAIWIADPLPADDLQPFWSALLSPAWVLHSGRQDLEVVHLSADRLPAELFDTQVAAALLGFPPQMGYGNLVAELFQVELAKSHTRADWSRRPLADAELAYAAEDVLWLLPAKDELCKRLDEHGRLEWVLEDCRELLDPALYTPDVAGAVERVKAARNLRGRARRAAVALASWREERALASDKPRQWILRDAVLMEIAERNPASLAALGDIREIPAGAVRRSGDELLSLLQAAAKDNDDYEPPARPDEEQKALLKALQKTVAATARELGLASEVLAPRRELVAAIAGERDLRVFRGWRRELLGNELLQRV